MLRERMLTEKTVAPGVFEAIEAEVKAVIEDGLQFATNSPWPDPATVTDHIYSE